jgi:hypothetical protein
MKDATAEGRRMRELQASNVPSVGNGDRDRLPTERRE